MTFSITLFLISWISYIILADKKRFFLFYSTCLLSVYIACAVDFLATEHYVLWDYPKGSKLLTYLYHLMQQLGVYPIVVYLFLQTLPKKQSVLAVIIHIFYWSLLALFIEWLAIQTGYMVYKKWWALGWSYAADWLLFLVFYFHYKWYERYKS